MIIPDRNKSTNKLWFSKPKYINFYYKLYGLYILYEFYILNGLYKLLL